MTPTEEAIELGHFAAAAELAAWHEEPGRARDRLLDRAARYRDLQLAALWAARNQTTEESPGRQAERRWSWHR
jgi:hypothetical protein